MKKFIINLALFIATPNIISAQTAPIIQWQKCLGGSSDDRANSIKQTSDGGFIVAGSTASNNGDVSGNHGSRDFWVVKLDANGNIQWQKCYGGTRWDAAYGIEQTLDGGYIVVGESNSTNGDVSGNHGGYDYWVIKINSSGNLLWQKCLGGTGNDYARAVAQQHFCGGPNIYSTNSYYTVVGYTGSNNGDVSGNHGGNDYWVVLMDSIGNVYTKNCFGGSGDDQATSVSWEAGQIWITGFSNSTDGDVTGNQGGYDVWTIWVNGSVLYATSGVNVGATGDDKAYGISLWPDCNRNNVTSVLVGTSNTSTGTSYLGSYNALLGGGNYKFGGLLDDAGYAVDMKYDSIGNIVSAGYTGSNNGDVSGNHGGGDYWLVKLTATSNNIQWQKCLGGSGFDEARAVKLTSDGGVIVAGYTNSNDGDVSGNHGGGDLWVVKLNTCNNIASANISGNTQICPNQTITLSASIASSYLWSNGSTASNIIISTAGTYAVTVTTSGCTATASVNVTNLPSPTASITASGDSPFCNGGNVDLSASGGDNYLWSNGLGVNQNISISQADTYEVTVTNANGCSATATEVIAESPPVAPVVSSNSPVAVGSTITLSSNAIAGAAYQWSGPNNFSSNQQNPSISNATALNSGDYSLVVSVNGCVANPVATNVVINNTDTAVSIINVDGEKIAFAIQPNPFNHAATLNIESTVSADLKIVVLDINGRVVENQFVEVKCGKQAIEIGKTLPSGSYVLQIQNNRGKLLKNYRLIKTN